MCRLNLPSLAFFVDSHLSTVDLQVTEDHDLVELAAIFVSHFHYVVVITQNLI